MRFLDGLTRPEIGNLRGHRLTGSQMKTIMTGTYKGWNSLAKELRDPKPYFAATSVAPLAWGLKWEPVASAQWWWRAMPKGLMVTDAFCFAEDDRIGCTPDVLMIEGLDTILEGREFKCPYKSDVHLGYLADGVCPTAYIPQVQHCMWVTGLEEWGFTSFDPRQKHERHRHMDIVVTRDVGYIEQMAERTDRFFKGFESGEDFKPPKPLSAKELMEVAQ